MKRQHKKREIRPEPVSSEPVFHPDATVGPDASLESILSIWTDKESTNAPQVGEEEPESKYASGYPELLEKLLHDKIPLRGKTVSFLIIIAWFGFISWLFIQDNSAGKLADLKGLKWFSIKALFYSALYILASIVIGLISWITRRPNKAT